MLVLFVFLLLYALVVIAERRLVLAGPSEWEAVRRNGSPTAAAQLAVDIRPALSALMLARIVLVLFMALGVFTAVYQASGLRSWVSEQALQRGWNSRLLWLVIALMASLVLSLLLWVVQRPLWPRSTRPPLAWVCAFARFWQVLFRPFIRHRETVEREHQSANRLSNPAEPTPGTGQGRSDLELLKSIVKFSDVTVKQVMQPRSKVVAADFRTPFHELLLLVREAGFSRMPVYDEDLDNVTGILYVKDLVAHLDKDSSFEWQALIRTNVLQVPESKHVSGLLEDFKRQKMHMAIVVDEYGGTAGLVTMEDVLEEILGEIRDEFDEESEVRYRKLDDHTYQFEGQCLLSDVCRIAGLPDNTFHEVRGNADTLAGLALELNGDIPAGGEELKWNGFSFKVVSADNRRIKLIRFTLPAP